MCTGRRALALAAAMTMLARFGAAQAAVPVVANGDPANRLDVVFLGDGYTADLLPKFAADAATVAAGLLAAAPYAEYRSYFNVWRIDVASNQMGASHPSKGVTRDTAFGATYDCGGVARRVCVNSSKVNSALTAVAPNQRDLVVVLVNDPEYGASGGTITVASMHSQVVELVLHEQAHTLGLLCDEYVDSQPTCSDAFEPVCANATKETARSAIKWLPWIDPATPIPTTWTVNAVPGLYRGAHDCESTLFRPTYNSKMRSLGQEFHAINEEQLVRRFYAYVDPVESVSPAPWTVISLNPGQSQEFSVTTTAPASHAMSVGWWLDGRLAGTSPAFSVSAETIGQGLHDVEVIVTDPTSSVRSDRDGLRYGSRTWQVLGPGSTADFSFAADATSAVVTRGGSASVGLTVVPGSGSFLGPVTFSCAGLPDQSQCVFTPTFVPAKSATATVKLTVTTTAPSSASIRFLPGIDPHDPWGISALVWLGACAASLSLARTGRRSGTWRSGIAAMLTALAVIGALTAGACGGQPQRPPAGKTINNGTATGTYGISVNAASGSVTHTVVVTVTVQ
jgi:hypothetical protein